jgi:hypothetical protein
MNKSAVPPSRSDLSTTAFLNAVWYQRLRDVECGHQLSPSAVIQGQYRLVPRRTSVLLFHGGGRLGCPWKG